MAGRRALTATEFEMPPNLRSVIVGPTTATDEIRWTLPPTIEVVDLTATTAQCACWGACAGQWLVGRIRAW